MYWCMLCNKFENYCPRGKFLNFFFARSTDIVEVEYRGKYLRVLCVHGNSFPYRTKVFDCSCCFACKKYQARKGDKYCFACRRHLNHLENVFQFSTNIVEAEVVYAPNKGRLQLKTLCAHGNAQVRSFATISSRHKSADQFDCRCDAAATLAKRRRTFLTRYGVAHPMHVPAFAAKAKATAFSFKAFTWPSGRITKCQGHEHFLYPILLEQYVEDEIVTENVRPFRYMTDDLVDHVYTPDAIVGQVVYEVKSPFTYKLDVNVERKVKAVIDENFTFEIFIFTSRHVYWRLIHYADGRRHMLHPPEAFPVAATV